MTKFHFVCSCLGKKKFFYRGCGWKSIDMTSWAKEKKNWIMVVCDLFNQMFGNDFLVYIYTSDHGTQVSDEDLSGLREYNHDCWEVQYANLCLNNEEESSTKGEKDNFCKPRPPLYSDLPSDVPASLFPANLVNDQQDDVPASAIENFHSPSSLKPKHIKHEDSDDYRNENVSPHGLAKDAISNTGTGVCAPPKCQSNQTPEKVTCEDTIDDVTAESLASRYSCLPSVNEGGQIDGSNHSVLRVSMKEASTRAELAALFNLIPPISSNPSSGIRPVYEDTSLTNSDPFTLNMRPCENIVKEAQKLFDDEKDKGNKPAGINIEGIGQFSEAGLSVLKQFCTIGSTRSKVCSEANWFNQLRCPSQDLVRIQQVLWHQSSTDIILRFGKKAVDITSFADLALERYIDSFVIDISIGKYLEEARTNGNENTLYFPSEVFDWMKATDKNFKKKRVARTASELKNFNTLQQVLVPVHMPNHWGLIYIDLLNVEMYFDDGLRYVPPCTVLPTIKDLLELLTEMHPSHATLQTKFWVNCNRFKRFGMPYQRANDSKMVGAGSCGIGVIMAARDFLEKGPSCMNSFKWKYSDMDLHRKNLMLQILDWACMRIKFLYLSVTLLCSSSLIVLSRCYLSAEFVFCCLTTWFI